jgi:multidrug efflux system membrane fusion protein
MHRRDEVEGPTRSRGALGSTLMSNDPSREPNAAPQRPADAATRRPKLKMALLGVLLVASAIGVILVLRGQAAARNKAPAPPPPVTVTIATARTGDLGVYLDAIGTVTPVYTSSITSQVTGLVVAVHYTEGQRIEKGGALIDIDPRPFEATLLQAQGTLEHDENVLAQAKMDLERYRAAWARNAIAKQLLDDQEKLVLQTEGTVKTDQGTVKFDQVQLDFCHITAPFTGRVGLRLVDPGNVVQSAGTVTLVVITQIEPITVVFTIPEDSIGRVADRLRHGAKLAVEAFDRTAQRRIASGFMLSIDNEIDTTTGTVKGRAQFDNKDDALFPNQFVNTRLLVDTLLGATLIPASAIQQNGPMSFVYLIENGVAHTRTVKPGPRDGDVVQVDGIAPGNVVADSSFDKLRDNSPVAISGVPAPGPGANPGP